MYGGYRKMTIQEWMTEIHNWAESKGWHDTPLQIEKELMNFHSEITEAWEELRKGLDLHTHYFVTKEGNIEGEDFESSILSAHNGNKPEGFPIEIADLAIRILHSCAYHRIDIEKYMELKMEYNKTRSYRHGNKKA